MYQSWQCFVWFNVFSTFGVSYLCLSWCVVFHLSFHNHPFPHGRVLHIICNDKQRCSFVYTAGRRSISCFHQLKMSALKQWHTQNRVHVTNFAWKCQCCMVPPTSFLCSSMRLHVLTSSVISCSVSLLYFFSSVLAVDTALHITMCDIPMQLSNLDCLVHQCQLELDSSVCPSSPH